MKFIISDTESLFLRIETSADGKKILSPLQILWVSKKGKEVAEIVRYEPSNGQGGVNQKLDNTSEEEPEELFEAEEEDEESESCDEGC